MSDTGQTSSDRKLIAGTITGVVSSKQLRCTASEVPSEVPLRGAPSEVPLRGATLLVRPLRGASEVPLRGATLLVRRL